MILVWIVKVDKEFQKLAPNPEGYQRLWGLVTTGGVVLVKASTTVEMIRALLITIIALIIQFLAQMGFCFVTIVILTSV